MTTTQTVALSFRIRTDIAEKVPHLAERRHVTESRLLEELLQEEARRVDLDDADPDDPNAALDVLLEEVKKILKPSRGAPAALNEDATLHVFNEIKGSGALLATYTAAIVPPPKSTLTAAGRRQSVNQQIGRFVKTFLGMQSLEEVTLPPGSDALIRSYTKLG